jgi:hypothetical protein
MTYPLPHHAKLRAAISSENIKPLKAIPGVGTSLAKDLYLLGIRQISDLQERSPEVLFKDLCQLSGVEVDPCVLYTFRCAVYYASATAHDPELLKWWNWKKRKLEA